MKKTVLRLSLVSALSLVISACSFSKDALFPSLVGSDSQEEIKTRGTNIVDLDGNALPELGSTNFEPVEVSEGGNTGTFVGQKVVSFRNELSQLQVAIRQHNAELQKIRASVIANAQQYHKTVGTIEAKLQVGTTPGNPNMFALLQNAQNNIQIMNANTELLSFIKLASCFLTCKNIVRFFGH